MKLKVWFESTLEQLKMHMPSKKKDETMGKIGLILGECFRGVSEFFAFTSEQLTLFIELIEDPNWKFEVYMAGIGRMVDC